MLWEETTENGCFVHFELHRMFSEVPNSILQASIFVHNSTKCSIRKVNKSGQIYIFSAFYILSRCILKRSWMWMKFYKFYLAMLGSFLCRKKQEILVNPNIFCSTFEIIRRKQMRLIAAHGLVVEYVKLNEGKWDLQVALQVDAFHLIQILNWVPHFLANVSSNSASLPEPCLTLKYKQKSVFSCCVFSASNIWKY